MREHFKPISFFIVSAALLLAGCKPEAQTPQASQQPTEQTAWETYEDRFIRFQYPPNYFVARATDSVQKIWMAGLPDEHNPGIPQGIGSFGINGYYNGTEKRPLKDIYAKRNWGGHKLTTNIKSFSPKNAECLMALAEGSTIAGCVDSHGKALEPPQCSDAYLDMQCYDKSQNYFTIGATLGRFEKGFPPPSSVADNLAIVERILKSLEFK